MINYNITLNFLTYVDMVFIEVVNTSAINFLV